MCKFVTLLSSHFCQFSGSSEPLSEEEIATHGLLSDALSQWEEKQAMSLSLLELLDQPSPSYMTPGERVLPPFS